MKTYYIYHIPEFVYPCGSIGKIGVTQQLRRRINDNKIKSIEGFDKWELLEEHTDVYEVSDREIELQKQYGYKVDKVLYWKTLITQSKLDKGGVRSLITLQYDKDGNFIKEWKSAKEAGKTIGIYPSSITRTCNNERNTAGGFVWKYKDEKKSKKLSK